MADREFIGAEWFGFLRRQGIRRAVRIRQNTLLDEVRVDGSLETLQVGEFREVEQRTLVFGEWMRVVATRSPAGDLVIIATDFGVWETWQLYQQRWSIECTFSSMKSRGFDLERTGITDSGRLERLFGLMTLAWLCCLRVGVWWNELKPIKVLKHGRKAVSFVRYGSEQLRNALRWNPRRLAEILPVLISPFFPPESQESEVVRY